MGDAATGRKSSFYILDKHFPLLFGHNFGVRELAPAFSDGIIAEIAQTHAVNRECRSSGTRFSARMLARKDDEILSGNKKGGHTGRPISNLQGTSARLRATSFLRQASLRVGEPASVPAAPVFAKCPPCRP